ncbi:MAG: twin-arginine translocase TatA/TatE family subunit [Ignavibacteriaceae bacterium]|jgi:sec-independent protein translocase protein TatA|nr:twin-arginine translocase TatA/TatE family subunit [Ignavibacteriaceae bacterium]
MFEDLGIGKLLIIFAVIMILFGSKKLPDLAKGLGKGIRDFKSALKGEDEDESSDKNKKSDK